MKAKKTLQPLILTKGQYWITRKGDVEIMEVGKALAHYRLFLNEKRAPTRMGGIDVVVDYLRKHKGRLGENPRLKKLTAQAT